MLTYMYVFHQIEKNAKRAALILWATDQDYIHVSVSHIYSDLFEWTFSPAAYTLPFSLNTFLYLSSY